MHPPTIIATLHEQLCLSVRGNERAVELLLVALLARGHVLIEGAAGVGKTSLALAMARVLGGEFKRIQFTPDLVPADILGYHGMPPHLPPDAAHWQFLPGPIFANCVLADEINRTPPRVQAALLEAMSESQVTLDGITHQLPQPFFVIATQNEQHGMGTHPLPLAQLDRFTLSISMQMPSPADQALLLANRSVSPDRLPALLSSTEICSFQAHVEQIPLHPSLASYIVSLCSQLRALLDEPSLISMRALLHLRQAAKAQSWLDGTKAVHPEHIQSIFSAVMRHRLSLLAPEESAVLLAECLSTTQVP